jgi:hypothetical protein
MFRVLLSRDLEGMVGGKRSREGSQRRAIRRLRDRGNFTGFPSERDGSRKFWTVEARNTKTGTRYSLGSFTTLEDAPVS